MQPTVLRWCLAAQSFASSTSSMTVGECTLSVVGNPDIEESTAIPCSTVPIPTAMFFTGLFACTTIFVGLVTVTTVDINAHCVIQVPSGVIYESTHGTIVVHPAVLPGLGPVTEITAHCPAERT
jgi:hypothetical protein